MNIKTIFTTFSLLFSFYLVKAQNPPSWEMPMAEVKYQDPNGESALLKIDQGFRYAELESKERKFRLFFHRNRPLIKNIRIIDQNSDLEIARGRGGFFLGNARIEFIDVSVIKLDRKNFPNGYEITGPFGPLFLVKNHAFTPIKTYEENDFLAQAMFLFQRIRDTQNPPQEVIYHYNSITYSH